MLREPVEQPARIESESANGVYVRCYSLQPDMLN